MTLRPGAKIDRFGTPKGTFATQEGLPFEVRALPSSSIKKDYYVYQVIKPMSDVKQSKTLPWFGQRGQGIQYELPHSIEWYVKRGYLKESK